jgi:hypothetical protein
MDFRPPPVQCTLISQAATWDPLHHLSQAKEKRWAESSRSEFPDYKLPEDDERTKFEARQYNRKDDPTNRMYTEPVAFAAPSAPFRPTATFKSTEEIDIELATIEASKLMSKLPSVPKSITSICPLEEILGTDNDGYKVGAANSLVADKESCAKAEVCQASESLASLTTVDVANAIVSIAPIFYEYHQMFVDHQCDGNVLARMTEGNIETMVALFSSWGMSNSIHRLRIAQAFAEWRTNPPKTVAPRETHPIKVFNAAETYGITLQKAGVLASEIPTSSKVTSLNIDQHFSHFKRLSLVPLKKTPLKDSTSAAKLTSEAFNVADAFPSNKNNDQLHDLSVKYRIPRDKLSMKTSLVPEKETVSQSDCIANRLSSSQIASDLDNTAAKIRHFIDTPVASDEHTLQVDDALLMGFDSKQQSGAQAVLKSKKLQVTSFDTSPNVYSRPMLPASRYSEALSQVPISVKYGVSKLHSVDEQNGAKEELKLSMDANVTHEVEMSPESDIQKFPVEESEMKLRHFPHAVDLPNVIGQRAKSDLSPKKARQNSPNYGPILSRVLAPKLKAEGPSSSQRPSSATHRVIWIDETEREENQIDEAFENDTTCEATQVLEAMKVKTPLTIYLNAADKNFRPTKSKYNAGLQLVPLRQGTDSDGLNSKFESKQRSAGLRFGERTAGASTTGVSASGVQFNPVSALFRSKRWKSCSNYHLFTSKLKASKDLQRFARSAATPHFKKDFSDEKSILRCIESSKLFALHFVVAAKYDDLGDLQPQIFVEEGASTDTFFWTGLTE